MATQPTRGAERSGHTPVGTINVVDPHPLNWLYITWNTMEGPRERLSSRHPSR